MRVTSNSIKLNIQRQIKLSTSQLMKTEEQVSSQKKINAVSDDPVAAGRVLELKSSISRSKQYTSNISRATDVAKIEDETLSSVSDLLGQAKETLLTETNEASSTATTRESGRIQISTLLSQLVELANTQYDGSYIFSGFKSDTPSFSNAKAAATATTVTGDATVTDTQVSDQTQLTYDTYQIRFTSANQFSVVDTTTNTTIMANQAYTSGQPITFGGVQVTLTSGALGPANGDVYTVTETKPGTYQGDGQTQQIEVQQGERVALNIPGNEVFQGAGGNGGVDIFDTLNKVQEALKNNDKTAMSDLLNTLDSAMSQLTNTRSKVGARTNLLTQVSDRQDEIQDRLSRMSSNLEDLDLTQAAVDLASQQNAYQATLSAAAKISQVSLFDFLS